MKHLHLAGLLVVGLFLASCSNTSLNPEAQTGELTKTAVALGADNSGLSIQAAGDLLFIADLIGSTRNLGTNETGFTQLLRHFEFFARIDDFTTESDNDPVFKGDSNWKFVAPLAASDQACFSIESQNFPGFYLRHFDSRVRIAPIDQANPGLFASDATWCGRVTLDGASEQGQPDYAFTSFNFPDRFLRRFNGQVWIAQSGGPLPSDTPDRFVEDTKWSFYAPFE